MPRSVRDIAIVFILLGASLLILFSSDEGAGNRPVTNLVYALVRPFHEIAYGIHSRLSGVWNGYIALRGTHEQNMALKEEIRELKRERALLKEEENENKRLRKLLNLKDPHEFPSLVAQVTGEDAVGWYRAFFINRGSEDGIASSMPVSSAEGVVGKILRCSSDMAQVLLLTDPNLSIDCRVSRTRDRGVLKGAFERGCVLRYISLASEVRPGDVVVTSGLDGVFPRGLPVGQVELVRKGDQGLFLEAQVKPAVDFSEIEEVLVILGRKGGFDIQPGLEEKR